MRTVADRPSQIPFNLPQILQRPGKRKQRRQMSLAQPPQRPVLHTSNRSPVPQQPSRYRLTDHCECAYVCFFFRRSWTPLTEATLLPVSKHIRYVQSGGSNAVTNRRMTIY